MRLDIAEQRSCLSSTKIGDKQCDNGSGANRNDALEVFVVVIVGRRDVACGLS